MILKIGCFQETREKEIQFTTINTECRGLDYKRSSILPANVEKNSKKEVSYKKTLVKRSASLTPITNSQPVPAGQDEVIPLRTQIDPLSFILGSFALVSSTAQT